MADEGDHKEKTDQISQRVKESYTRRDFLKTTGIAATLGAASAFGVSSFIQQNSRNNNYRQTFNTQSSNPTGMATGGDYETITVGAGETFTKDLSNGETWSNKLIDITAQNASYRITATSNNWEIRNIGVRGQINAGNAPSSMNFVAMVPDSGATGHIENVYLPGTSYSRGNPQRTPAGIYVHYRHSGEINIHNYYAKDFPSHALYGSDPANTQTGGQAYGGTVNVHNSFCSDCENSGWRLGTGSYVRNSVSFRTVRGVWARWGPVDVINCDLGDNGTDLVTAQGGSINLENTRYGTERGQINGSSAGTPEERVPEGCPTSPEEAASGDSSGTGTGGTETGGTSGGNNNDSGPHTITVSGGSPNNPRGYIIKSDSIQKKQGDGIAFDTSATGKLEGETHKYQYSGQLKDVKIESGIEFRHDGQELTDTEIALLCGGTSSVGTTDPNNGSESNSDTNCSSPRDSTVDLSDGDDIASVLQNIGDGDTVVLPRGNYTLSSNVSINASNWKFDGNGSTIETHGRLDITLEGQDWDFGYLDIKPQNEDNPDAWCRIRPQGRGWKFHHVAWTKRNNTRYINGDNRRLSCLLPGVDKGHSGEITDCWFGHGCHLDHGKSAIKCWGVLDGELWIKRCHFKQMGVYGANSSKDYVRNEGVTNFEDCYFENCYNGCARTGSHFEPAHIRGCVMNTSDPSQTPTREGHGSSGPYNRGVWAFHGPVIVEDTHITSFDRAADVSLQHNIKRTPSIEFRSGAYDGQIKNEHRVEIDSSVGNNPQTTPPDNCVNSAEEAVSCN